MDIKINKNLNDYANFDPTKESHPRKLEDLCDDIEKGNVVLPIFQTYIRWQIEKSIDLLNFQLSGKAAVAPISMNRMQEGEDVGTQITFIERKQVNQNEIKGKVSVIDGQQRLTCNYKAYSNHPDFKNIVLDLSLGKFVLNVEALKPNQVPVGILYNKDANELEKFILEQEQLQPFKISGLLGRIRNKFLSYYYTINYANNLNETEQLQWFEVLNLAGTKVTGIQVQLTEMLVKGVDYYTEYAKVFLDNLEQAGLDNLLIQKSTELSIPLSMLNPAYEVLEKKKHKSNFCPIPSDVKPSLISKQPAEKIRDLFYIAIKGLKDAIAFIEDNNITDLHRIDYITYLAGAFMYIGNRILDNNEKSRLIEWVNNTDFTDKGNSERRDIFESLIDKYTF